MSDKIQIDYFPDTITFRSTGSTIKLIEESIEWVVKKINNRKTRVKAKSKEAAYKYIFVKNLHPTVPNKLMGSTISIHIDHINRLNSFELIDFSPS